MPSNCGDPNDNVYKVYVVNGVELTEEQYKHYKSQIEGLESDPKVSGLVKRFKEDFKRRDEIGDLEAQIVRLNREAEELVDKLNLAKSKYENLKSK